VQHYDHQVASVTHQVVEQGQMPTYPEEAQEGVKARYGEDAEVTPYQVVMQRLDDPVYAVLWKGFNILFLLVAVHHGFYGLNNVLTDYIRDPMGRAVAKTLSWGTGIVLLIIGIYSVVTAGW